MEEINKATRIHLKTSGKNRGDLIKLCLESSNQFLAIGWSYVYEKNNISDYESYYYSVKNSVKRINHALNVFWNAKENDLFWTRDLDGYYWICRATGKAKAMFVEGMDIGSIIPIKAYKFSMEIPGKIKASFNRPRGGTCEDIWDNSIVEYSKYIYNDLSGEKLYSVNSFKNNILENLPDFDLEELVISYLQIHENYYVLSNSIANKSTTVKIECELMSRDKNNFKKAVVQVKGGKVKTINALDYKIYSDNGYEVYLYAPNIINIEAVPNCKAISSDELLMFYNEYKNVLSDSITKWEKLI